MSQYVAFMVDGSSTVVELDEMPTETAGLEMHCDFLPAIDGSLLNVQLITLFQPVVDEVEQPTEQFKKGWFRR